MKRLINWWRRRKTERAFARFWTPEREAEAREELAYTDEGSPEFWQRFGAIKAQVERDYERASLAKLLRRD